MSYFSSYNKGASGGSYDNSLKLRSNSNYQSTINKSKSNIQDVFLRNPNDSINSSTNSRLRGNSGFKNDTTYKILSGYNDRSINNKNDFIQDKRFSNLNNNSNNIKNLIQSNFTSDIKNLNGGGNCIPSKEVSSTYSNNRNDKALNKLGQNVINSDNKNVFNQNKPNSKSNKNRETESYNNDSSKKPVTIIQPKNDFENKNFIGDNYKDLIKGLESDNYNKSSNTTFNNSEKKSNKENDFNSYGIKKDSQNNNFDKDLSITNKYLLNKSDNNGKVLVGFRNLGNTCYMNTSLQLILNCDEFIEKLLNTGVRKNKSGVTQEFINLCKEYRDQSFKKSYHKEISPSDFKRIFGKTHRKFEGYQQQDSQEFLRNLLDDISTETNESSSSKYKEIDDTGKNKKQLKEEYDNFYLSREDSVVTKYFNGEFITIFACSNCNNESYSFQKFIDIPIYLSKINLY